MEQNQELRNAWNFVEHTGVSIFLTGKAGTGKTTFLRQLAAHSAKTMIVVAPTGVAAINAGGVTIHSFFQLPISPFVPGVQSQDRYGFGKDKLRIVRALDLLVIDEISMVRADLLDAIDAALRKYRRSALPFGGVQLLMIGDLQQLSPVVTPADEAMLRPYYDTYYFFGSKALAQIPYVTIQLTKVYRQQNEEFVNLLNHVRDGRLTDLDRRMLAGRLQPGFRPGMQSDYIRLTTHNHMADDYNAMSLLKLNGRSRTYSADVKGDFPESSFPTPRSLQLKAGAQVMFIKNDPEGRFYNGKIGHVTGLDADSVTVKCPGDSEEIEVLPMEWENTRYTINAKTNTIESKVEGTFSQLPLRLSWAVTIHKSQGLTFDHVIIDAGQSFAPGQVYVALSRCRTLEGIVLATPIEERALLCDTTVAGYIAGQDAAAERSLGMLGRIRDEYRRRLLLDLFTFRSLTDLQEQLRRLMMKELVRQYPGVATAQQELADSLRERVTSVADKWIGMLSSAPIDSLAGPAVLERVKSGCRYFSATLRELMGETMKVLPGVRSGDKKVMQRLSTIVTDLTQAFRSRVALLDAIAENGFTTVNYLTFKQQATLGALGRNTARPTGKATREKARKEKKPDTKVVTLQLLRQGMTPDEIAGERRLTRGTILRHLQYYIHEGEIELEDVYTPAMINAMASALDQGEPGEDFQAIYSRLRHTGLFPSDLKFYMDSLK